MTITSALFEAYLKCPTKFFLRSIPERGEGNEYADWVQTQNDEYRGAGIKRLAEEYAPEECVAGMLDAADLKTGKWRLASNIAIREYDLETSIHAVERDPSGARGKGVQLIPIRFVSNNKITKDDRLLLAFDALALSGVLGKAASFGKIIHGSSQVAAKINLSEPLAAARAVIAKIAQSQANPTPPRLMLIKHCIECEFRSRCRGVAVEKDDLSLLSSMSEGDQRKQQAKGIFTVTQLAYTFRPRRRHRRLASRPERYRHELKALAIRDKKIHVVGSVCGYSQRDRRGIHRGRTQGVFDSPQCLRNLQKQRGRLLGFFAFGGKGHRRLC